MKHCKSENKFRFIGFNERIKNIHVDITRQCRSFETAPDDEETFFAQTLAKQSELNYSKEFSDFLQDISTLAINTYPLLIFHKDEILRKLKKHLLEKNVSSISSLLELCIAVCRDLHDEFQPYFWEIFEVICDILSVYNDPDVLEACFSTLAYLLKFSWRRMIHNSRDVFQYDLGLFDVQHFQHLLSHTKEYIRRFSAEALVFFIRKASDFGDIVEYCLRKIGEDNALLLGMAELFIQCIIGPQNNFHGKAKMMMQTLLSFVHISPLKETAYALLCQVNIALVQHAVVDTAAVIFDCILDEGDCFFDKLLRNDNTALDVKVAYLMDLTSAWIEMKQGCLVPFETKEKIIKNWLMRLLVNGNFEWKIFNSFINLGRRIFHSPDVCTKCTILGDFLNLLFDVGAQLEHAVLIMPDSLFVVEVYQCRIIRFFASYTDRYLVENEIFKNCRLLASLCKMSSLTETNAVGNGQWPLATRRLFSPLQKGIIVNLLDLIFTKFSEQFALTGSDKAEMGILLPHLICAALIYPMVTMDRDEHVALVNVTTNLALSSLVVVGKEYSLALRCLFKAVHQIKESTKLTEMVIYLAERMLANLHSGAKVAFYLEATVSCVEYLNDRLSNFDLRVDVIDSACRAAISNLWLSDVGTRVLSLRLLRHLCTLGGCRIGVDFADLCLEAESVPATIHQYRQRLLVYMKICSLCKSGSSEKTVLRNWSLIGLVLRFLVGQFHVNLSLLWNYVIETIVTTMEMANDADQCWTVMVDALEFGTANLANSNTSEQCCFPVEEENILSQAISDRLGMGESNNNREDFVNFRHLVWLTLDKLAANSPAPSGQVERIVDSALSWFNVEYQFNDMNTIWFDSGVAVPCDSGGDVSVKLQAKTAVAVLNVLGKLSKNHRRLFVRLESLYTRLLRQTRREVQAAALNCVLGLDGELEIYRPYLSCLLTGDNFCDKLIKLACRFDQLAVEESKRRRRLATVLLNLVYGLLRSRGSGSTLDLRRHLSQLFAFLGYCNSDELNEFFGLVISPIGCHFHQHCSNNQIGQTIQALDSVFEGRTVADLRYGVLGEIVEFLNQMVEKVSDRMDEKCQRRIFHAALILQAIVNWIQLTAGGGGGGENGKVHEEEEEEETNEDGREEDYVWKKRGKKIRKRLDGLFVKFSTQFGEYPFSDVELGLLFELVVWPALVVDDDDNVQGRLCKLFVVWSESELLWPLLYCSKWNCSPVHCMVSTLGKRNAPAAVHRFAIDLVDGLLQLDSNPDSCWATNSEIANFAQKYWKVVDVQHRRPDFFVENYAEILIAYCREDFEKSGDHRRPIDRRKLDILCRLCGRLDVARSRGCGSSLITSLFEQLQCRAAAAVDDEIEIQLILLDAVLRLLEHSSNDTLQYLDSVINLYACLRQRSVRTRLHEIFTAIVADDPEYIKLSQIIDGLNSWNKRQVEEFDYDRRLAAHQQANHFLYEVSKRALKPTLTLLFYNCFHFIELVDDLSLRTNATHTVDQCFHCMSTRLVQDEWNSILNNIVLPYLTNALKNQNDIIRNSFVGILRSCILKFAIFHDQLKPLFQLVDNVDLELDFFENIRHIQLHRRARALRRLCDQLETSSDPNTAIRPRQIRLYILPLISAYLSDETFSNKHPSLVDECVHLISCYCRLANWTSYSCILRKYLHKLKTDLDNQKLHTRIVVSILDSFHFINFDLPSSRKQQHVVDSLSKIILPKLKAALIGRIDQVDDNKFDLHRRRAGKLKLSNETDELIRVPIALAMIKLLVKLPAHIASSDISSTILKVCNMLKSRWLEVRNLARKTLCSMLNSLGSAYLAVVLKELRSTLKKGFQMHVLCYTVHMLLEITCSSENFLENALDAASLRDILEICHGELFGSVAEEKRAKEVLRSVWEAKAVKVFNTYAIIGRFVSKHNLFDVLDPLKEVLKQSPNHEMLKKISNCLKQFALGVSKNTNLTVETLMVFCYEVLNDGLQSLCRNDCKEQQQQQIEKGKSLRPAPSFLFPPEPGRRGFAVNVSKRTNMHLLISFALDVLLSLLRAGKLSAVETESLSLLDPFVDNLILCLNAAYPKIISVALRCLTNIVKYPLLSLEKNIDSLVKTVFTLLHNYACLGVACRGDSRDVLRNCFKLITAVIVYSGGKAVNGEQMDILLRYSEEDLADTQKQATAFSVVKAIFAKRHYSGTVEAILSKLQNLSITSGLEHVRVQCRQAIGIYFKFNYVKNKKKNKKQQLFVKAVEFFCVQLNYAEESGRVSALEMLEMLLSMAKSNLLPKIDTVVFLHLSARLQIDQSERCRNIIALAIKKLISRVSREKFAEMFNVTLDWIGEDEIALKQTGALCLSLLFDENRTELVEKMPIAMQMIFSQFQKYLPTFPADDDDQKKKSGRLNMLQKSTSDDRCIDHFLFALLNLCQKIIKAVPLDDDRFTCKWLPFRETLIEILLKTLLYPHVWVRTSASQFLGCCLLFIVNSSECKSVGESDHWNNVLFEFCEKLFEQLKIHHNNEELIEQSVKNLVFIAKQTPDYNVPQSDQPKQLKKASGKRTFCLSWMIRRLIRLSRMELVKNAKLSLLRSYVFKWIAAVALQCNDTTLRNNLHTFLPLLYRELTVANNDENLKILSTSVCEIVQNRVGLDAFSTEWNKCQNFAAAKRLERKRRLATEVLSDPVEAAKRRIKRQKLKIVAKKKMRTTLPNKPYSSNNEAFDETLVEHETFE